LFNHIVVPLDGSKLSETALEYVTPLASRMNAKVVLLHAISAPYGEIFDDAPDRIEAAAAMRRRATASGDSYMAGVAELVSAEGVECETHVGYGAPAAVILNYIERHRPDLIAMSTHGRSGLRRMVVGSVTTAILPRAETPVLVVHPDEDGQIPAVSFETLVIPLDMSSRSEDVLPLATRLAETLNLNARLITCIPSPSQLYIGSVPEVYPYPDDLMQQTQDATDDYLEEVLTAVNEGRKLNAQWESLEGGPASRIVEYAQAQPNSLIAMCTQGRTGLGRLVLGSVTDAVIRTGNTPVLVIPHAENEG